MSLKFSDVERLPFFETSNINGVLKSFHEKKAENIFEPIMPLVNVNADKVEMDIDKANIGGMTPVVARGSETPLYKTGGRGKLSWESAEFREKVKVTEDELVDLRKIGTQNELKRAMELLGERYNQVADRLSRRIEWMRRQTLFDGAVSAADPNGVEVELLKVAHPDHMKPTVGTLWTNTANADPVNDMQLAVRDFQLYSGFYGAQVWAPMDALRIATQTQRFQDYAKNSFSSFQGTKEQVAQVLVQFMGGVNILEKPQHIPYMTQVAADAASGQANIVLSSVTELAAGDRIVLILPDRSQKLVVVSSLSGNTVTLTTNLTVAVPAGSSARYIKPLIPLDRLLILGAPSMPEETVGLETGTAGSTFLNQPFDVCSTLSGFANMENRTPGLFTKLRDFLASGDPPFVEQIIGIRALPRVHYVNSWMTLKFQ